MRVHKIKWIYTFAAGILLILLYIVIFRFSAEDAEHSSRASVKVTEFLLRLYYGTAGGAGGGGNGGGENIADIVPLVEGFVRKLAHFTEYMCMGLLSYSIVILWIRPIWRGWLIVVGQLFLSAGLDEFHQYFIPGRHASFKDVLIDAAGGVAGMFLLAVGRVIIKKLWKIDDQ